MSLSLSCAGFLWLCAAACRPGPGVLPWVRSEALEVICGWWGPWGWESLLQLYRLAPSGCPTAFRPQRRQHANHTSPLLSEIQSHWV